jgi:predicted NBD/HSP70 family sugar kinase
LDALLPVPARSPATQAVLGAMLRHGPVSRAELSRITGLSKQTTSEVVRMLLQENWARVHGQVQGAVGRSAVTYTLRHDVAHVLSIDLGGTKLHVALADLVGRIVGEQRVPTHPGGGAALVGQIGTLADALLSGAGLEPGTLQAATMGSPGVFQALTGRILLAPNIPGLDSMDVSGALAARLGCPVQIENDVNLAALGECWTGCCVGVDTFAFVALGTGIGMGIVDNGALLRGATGAAGEIAYLPLGSDPFDARLHRLGTLESSVGSAAILDRYNGASAEPAPDVRTIFDRLEGGDAAAATTLDETARLLAQACMAIRAMLDPGRIVFGGSIGSRTALLDRVRTLLARHMADPIPIEPSALGDRAAVMGGIGQAVARLQAELCGAGHAS